MPYSGAVDTAAKADSPLVFVAAEIILPGPTAIRLLDGSGFITIGGNVFTGEDATYGKIAGMDPITDGTGDQSPHAKITLLPPTNSAAAALASASNQGSAVTIYFGFIDRPTGTLIGTIDTWFVGEIDVGKLVVGQNSRAVDLDIASVWDRFFDVDEGVELNNAWHQSIWPGELGLSMVTAIQYQIPWGTDGARPNIVADGTAAGGANLLQRELQGLVNSFFR
jgi:hypothetical protein